MSAAVAVAITALSFPHLRHSAAAVKMLSASLLPGKPLLLLIETAISRSLSITETISLCSPFIPLLSVAVSQHSRCCISTASHPLSFPLSVEGKAAAAFPPPRTLSLPPVRTQHCCCRGAALLFVPNAGTAALLPPSAGLSSLHVISELKATAVSLSFSLNPPPPSSPNSPSFSSSISPSISLLRSLSSHRNFSAA